MDICTVSFATGRIVGWPEPRDELAELRRRLSDESAAAVALAAEIAGYTDDLLRQARERIAWPVMPARWA